MSKKTPQEIHEEVRPLLHADDFDPLRIAQVLLEWKHHMMRNKLLYDPEWVDALRVACESLDQVLARRKGMAYALMGVANLLRFEQEGRDRLNERVYRLERMMQDMQRGERAGGITLTSEATYGTEGEGG